MFRARARAATRSPVRTYEIRVPSLVVTFSDATVSSVSAADLEHDVTAQPGRSRITRLTEPSQLRRRLGLVRRVSLLALVAVVVTAACVTSTQSLGAPNRSAAQERRAASAEVFGGLGTWIDIYDTAVYRAPNATAARLAARGVQTAWIETANDRSTVDVVERAGLGRLVDALHTQGIEVVAWYLPGHDRQARDLRRARAMLSFVTQTGGRFDGVALDIESLREKNVPLRTTRMLDLLTRLRAEAGSTPVAAITYPPRAFERHLSWWPNFPWSQIAAQVDAFVPMLYTGGGFPGYDATYGYVARSLRLLRTAVGRPIVVHAAGGVANRMNADELKAFSDAVLDDGKVTGWSLYDLQTMTPAGWSAMSAPHRRPRLTADASPSSVRPCLRAGAPASRPDAPAAPSRRRAPA